MSVADTDDLVGRYLDSVGGDRSGRPDELSAGGSLRLHWAGLVEGYRRLGGPELARRQAEIRLQLEREGVTYNIAEGGKRPHRPWRLDPAPLILPDAEWRAVTSGVVQRTELLDQILADLYGPRRLLRTGVIPPAMILTDPHFVRACDGITLPGPHQLVLSATDLYRDVDGDWRAFGHRTQSPSGMAYALENRRVLARVFPTLFRQAGVRRLAPFIRALRAAVQSVAPPGVENPSVVVLSPGSRSETAYEHGAIASRLGYPLVEGTDLRIRNGRIWLKTVSEVLPVHVILRRVDALFCDPLELQPQSTLGVPGLVDACRTGEVSVINTLGSGVLENAGLQSILGPVARHILGSDLELPTVASWWCGDPAGRSHVLANLGRLVVRPLSRAFLHHSVDTGRVSAAELDDLRRRIEAEPERWVGQERVEPATSPVLMDGRLEPRATVLRTFAVTDGDHYLAMPGGLARTATDDPTLPIANRHGALAKDTWILGADTESAGDLGPIPIGRLPTVVGATPARAAENLFWLGRYAERAEATVRLLRVVYQRRADFEDGPAGPGRDALGILLQASTRITGTYPGFVGDDATAALAEPEDELFDLVVNGNRPGTVAHAIDRMFDAIDVVRDQLSVDTWLVVGSLQRRIEAIDPQSPDRDEAITIVLDELLHGLLSLSGLATESMVRDHGWHFMDAGRRIERALHVGALVGNTLGPVRDPVTKGLVLESVAAAAESIITYRRRYLWQARLSTLLDLLFNDTGNPRSIRFQLDRLTDDLAVLRRDRPDGAALSATPPVLEITRRLDELDTEALSVLGSGGDRPALADLVATIGNELHRAGEAIEADFFTRQLPQVAVSAPIESPRLPS